MLQSMGELNNSAIGFRAVGEVSGADYRNLILPACVKLKSSHARLKFLYHLGEEFKGFEYNAMWEDTKLGLRYYGDWKKIAIVTDRTSLAYFAWFSGLFIPGEVKIYKNKELNKAITWINE